VPEPPTGTVTFLFTDLEGSTRLWQEHADAMHDALARHDELVRTAVQAHGGHIAKTTGEGAHAAFGDAAAAIAAAVDALRDLARSERVFQVVRTDLRADVPPLQSLDAYPTNLPLQVTEFVGRASELTAVSKARTHPGDRGSRSTRGARRHRGC
jgi:hypothetical protein